MFWLWHVDLGLLAHVLRKASVPMLLWAVVLNLPQIGLKTIRWRFVLRAQGIEYGPVSAALAYFGSIFIGLLSPGRLGELVKALHLMRDCLVSGGRALASVLLDRLYDLLLLLAVGGLSLLSSFLAPAKLGLLVSIGAATVISILLFAILWSDALFAVVQGVGGRITFLRNAFIAKNGTILELRDGLKEMTLLDIGVGLVLTVLAYAIFFYQCYLLAQAIGLQVSFRDASFAVALGSLVTLLPISVSGLGTRDAAIITYLGAMGIPNEAALGFSFLVFVTFYIVGGLLGAVAWFIKPVDISPLKQRM